MSINISGASGTISVNGTTYRGRNINIENGVVTVDGVRQGDKHAGDIVVNVTGDVASLSSVSGDINVTGNVTALKTVSGDARVSGVTGSVSSTSGDIIAAFIEGDATSVSGDIYR